MAFKSFGSGYFGEWIQDEFGLPAYRYDCDQNRDPKAVTPVNPIWRSPTDHSHQVGNDRLVAVASNHGYVQVRQDEGGPKFLNDYDPGRGHYGGGFGYLTDGKATLSTFYSSQAESFQRIFGVGYYRKTVSQSGYTADQVIYAPNGDDPLLISQVTITNHRSQEAGLRWIEYWGCQMYQFSHRSKVISVISKGKKQVPDLRRAFASHFTQHFSPVEEGAGLLNEKKFQGYPVNERLAWAVDQFLMEAVAKKTTGGALIPPVKEAWLEDLTPPPTFLVSLDAKADGLSTDEAAFFGKGGLQQPDGLSNPLPGSLSSSAGGTAMLIERRLHLKPGESQTLYFAYGYLPLSLPPGKPGVFSLASLLARYRLDLAGGWTRSSLAWKEERVRLEIPGEPWIDRELTWHHYYLRSNLTYDSFYQEHILSQGNVYQYVIGFQGAARDPLQHALPFTFTDPDMVKEVLRYTLKEVLPDGEIPYAVTGHGMRMAVPYQPSDQELWLLWLASEYVLATRDTDFLEEVIPTFPLYGPKAGKAKVREVLQRCFYHLAIVTGKGKHGLLRLSNGDWNDVAVIGFVPKEQHEQVRKVGESVLNAAFATYVLDLYGQMSGYTGDPKLATEACALAEDQRKAVQDQWNGRWFRRSWLSESLGWIGEEVMWLEPQPWAILGGVANPVQTNTLVQSIDEQVRRSSPIGARLMSKPQKESVAPPGQMNNAGIWPSINGTLVWALALADGRLAWDEWKKNSLAYHAEAYPETWYGIWSGPDAYNSTLSKYPGQTFFNDKDLTGEELDKVLELGTNWTDFPVFNMHPHAWPIYDAVRLLGVQFTPAGLELAPSLPLPAYRLESPLLGFEKKEAGIEGWYAPIKAGRWQISLRMPDKAFSRLEVNGRETPLRISPDGTFRWSGESVPGTPLTWKLF